MPVSADPDLLLDTSAAVALVVPDHDHHGEAAAALAGARLGLAGHAAFETFSVLTRLPAPLRRTPQAVRQLLSHNFAASRFLAPAAAATLLDRLAALEVAGGAVYDALVAAVAVQHGLRLATRDRRALDTYYRLGVDLEVLA